MAVAAIDGLMFAASTAAIDGARVMVIAEQRVGGTTVGFTITIPAEAGVLANAVRIHHAALSQRYEETLSIFRVAAIHCAGVVIFANFGWMLAPFQWVAGIHGAGVTVVAEEMLG